MSDKLKPCPFCGGSDLAIKESDPSTARFNEGAVHFSVACLGMNCVMMPVGNLWHISPEDAISSWNTRDHSDIRSLMIERLDDIKKLLLSPRAVDIVRLAKSSEITSSDLANKYSISVANASAQLNKLYLKGYLSRVESIETTGGIMFTYKACI